MEPTLHACSPAPIPFQKEAKEGDKQPATNAGIPANVLHAVIAQDKLWENKTGDTIVSCFVFLRDVPSLLHFYQKITYGFHPSASDEMKTAVSKTITTWEKYANVVFDKVEDWTKAEIRISFDPSKGSWSAIGIDARNAAFNGKATMNFGWLKNDSDPSPSDKGTILHEFGHALGMMHEHQSPARGGTITLNEHEVYRYYRPLLQNRDALVKSQVIDVYSLSEVSNYSHFDEKSIMM
jgi:hypothetical protein